MAIQEITVPNIGDVQDVEVIEILVAPGDKVEKDQSLITLESDKASMEIPSPAAGEIKNITVKIGDRISQGNVIAQLITSDSSETSPSQSTPAAPEPAPLKEEQPAASSEIFNVTVPDIGDAKQVEVIEVLVTPGSYIKKDDSLITLESEKASMEIPSPFEGQIESVLIKVGDKVSQGDAILTLKGQQPAKPNVQSQNKSEVATAVSNVNEAPKPKELAVPLAIEPHVHAGPAVRRLAREFGIDLNQIKGSGSKARILKEDLQQYVKTTLQQGSATAGFQVARSPEIDFSKFGEIEKVPLGKIKRLTGINVHRSWITVPHVTQFGEADITELEEFRTSQKEEMARQGLKLTPLVFIMKAVVAALKAFPTFNASLDPQGETLILKKYFNLGIAVDTPNGLVVPVVKDVDQKGMLELARELAVISEKARKKGLSPADMSGSCFTISSLGGIGGTAFTPIVNSPDVAILGVSKAAIKPIYLEGVFEPRLMLPLSLSYDHRVIDGAQGARFLVHLSERLADIRTLLL